MMKRFPHRLKPNKACYSPSRVIVYDTETKEEKLDNEAYKHTLRLGWLCYLKFDRNVNVRREKWLEFKSKEEFWDFLVKHLDRKSKLLVFSHNQHFDFPVVGGLKYASKYNFILKRWIIDSQRFIILFKHTRGSVAFLDSLNYVKASIEEIGNVVGIKKLKVDFKTVNDEDLSYYCRRDVLILKEFLLQWFRFIKQHDLGAYRYTIASQSFTAFRHKFMTSNIFIHANSNALELERKSYRGGRNECYFIGNKVGQFYLLDVNSMYPYVMRNFPYPTRLIKYINNEGLSSLKRALKNFLVIADLEIETKEPVIGVKHEKLKKLIFPIGKFRCILTTPEIQYILKHGKIHNVYSYCIYDWTYLFKGYVDFFYRLKNKYKQENNKLWYWITKIYLNSLYGKFGQKNEEWIMVDDNYPDEEYKSEVIYGMEDGKVHLFMYLGNNVYKKIGERESLHSFPAIASHVTAYARMTLWGYIKYAGVENVLYCDTDSLLVNQKGYERLKPFIDKTKLGYLDVEGVYDCIEIRGCKDYTFGEKTKIKGIRKDAVRVAPNKYKQLQFMKIRSLLRNGISDFAVVKEVIKELDRDYKKGIVLRDGTVLPYCLPG